MPDDVAWPPVAVTVDLVVLSVRAEELQVVLVRRGEEPFADAWALPGGFVRPQEDLLAAAVRELAEETSLDARRHGLHLEQLASYGAPDRDPRQRVVTVAHLALAPDLPVPLGGTDAAEAAWHPVAPLLATGEPAAFDHATVLRDGVERARSKLEYTSLGAAFCPPEFTVSELRRVYETVWGAPLDPRNFSRKVTGTPGFLVPTGATTTRDGGRPARLYGRGDAALLHPPLLRPAATSR